MNRRPPLDFDISVSAAKKRQARARGMSGAVDSTGKACQKPGCDKPAKFRAPKSPDQLDDFFWFCLDHVREYNLNWNFFQGASNELLDAQVESDRVWNRPTRPFAGKGARAPEGHPEGRAWQRFGFDDPMEVLGRNGTLNPGAASAERSASVARRRLPPTERKALDILEARDDQTKTEIRVLYKALVKALHPDMNGGKRDDEDRLAEVVWAWEQIKTSRSFPD